MKKIFTLAAAAMISFSAMATTLFEGNQHVSWGDGGLQFAADQFTAAKAGDKIVVTFTGATDGIEFKVMSEGFPRLAGSKSWAPINGDGTFEQFLTPTALAGIQASGLEIIGANFTVTKIELLDGKNTLPEGYIVWTGYFWADEWSTLELVNTSYNTVDFSEYEAIRFISEAGQEEYIINFRESWEDTGIFATTEDMTITNNCAEWTLPTSAGRLAAIKNADHWMIQFSVKWGDGEERHVGNPFNVTDIVLVPKTPSAIENNTEAVKAVKTIENGQIVIIKNGVKFNAVGAKL